MSEQNPQPQHDAPQPEHSQPRPVAPLDPLDPPKVGDFWLDARLAQADAGIAYAAHDDAGTPVVLILLSAGAAGDGAARERFSGVVNKLDLDVVVARGGQGQNTGRLAKKFRGEDNNPISPDGLPVAPWVAIHDDWTVGASMEARRVLAAVGMEGIPNSDRLAGPDYQLPWTPHREPGRTRMWPLPWPGRYDRAGWMTLITSWLLMLLLMMTAILMAIILFQKAPPAPPPPPIPTSANTTASQDEQTSSPSQSPSSASPSSTSASPSVSPESGSPSPSSASPSPSSPSPSPSGDGSPTPNSKL